MPEIHDGPEKDPEKSSDRWNRLETLGEGPNPLSDGNWRYQLLQLFLGLLALFAVFLCIWNGILGFPILAKSKAISLDAALFGLAVLAGFGIMFYLATKPSE